MEKPIKLDGNDTTILLHNPYILCHFANYVCFLFMTAYTQINIGGQFDTPLLAGKARVSL